MCVAKKTSSTMRSASMAGFDCAHRPRVERGGGGVALVRGLHVRYEDEAEVPRHAAPFVAPIRDKSDVQ